MIITSTANARVKDVVGLRKPRERRASGRFVVEGRREVRRALAGEVAVEAIWWCAELGNEGDGPPPWFPDGQEIVEVARPVFERMSMREGPDGVLAVARDFDTSLGHLDPPPDALVLVAAGIEKPGNLGTMIRSAVAADADAVVVAGGATDVVNPNVIRASQGAVFDVPVGVADHEEAVAWLAERGITVFAADPEGAVDYWDAPLAGPAAIVIGSEHLGVPEPWRRAATTVRIPMAGAMGADSLNASAAAAVLLFDAVRQRRTR